MAIGATHKESPAFNKKIYELSLGMELSKRLQQVVQRLESLHEKVKVLEAENSQLRAANNALQHQLDAKPSAAPVGQNISERAPRNKDTKQKGVRAALDQDIRQQIDHYLKEIDKCIEWLGQQ